MTKKNAELILIKDAAIRLNKSVRTLKRYLDKVDKLDKGRMSTLSGGRVFVSLEFVELVENGVIPNKKTTKRKQNVNDIGTSSEKVRIEALEARNKELFEIIKKKDDLLEQKDLLIKENLQDFKTLTSKVLFLQEENKKLQIAPSVENISSSMPNFSKGLAYFFIVIFFFLGCWFLAYLLN